MLTIRGVLPRLALVTALLAIAYPAAAADWAARHGLTSAEYQAAFDQYAKEGFRLITVSGYEGGGTLRYAALWRKVPAGEWVARHGMSSGQYQQDFDHNVNHGYRLTYVTAYPSGGQVLFASIWEKRAGPAWVGRHNLTAAQYQQAFNELTAQGYKPIQVTGYAMNGEARYAAIFEQSPGPPWAARHGLTGAQYQQAFDEFTSQGFHLKSISGYRVGGQDLYAAVWEKSPTPPWSTRHGVPGKFYQIVFDNHRTQGYEPVFLNAFAGDGGSRFSGVWENNVFAAKDLDLIATKVDAYMKKHSVPGLSIAVTQGERLVYAAGFGLADKDSGEPVGPDTRFRVASVSKPITSAAIMELVEGGQLGLDDKVFGANSILGGTYTTPKSNPNIDSITVRHLLGHVAGFTTNGGDPMFAYTGTSQADLIKWHLADRALATTPGSRYEYSNFGYCLLGRIIEAKSGQGYEQYVKNAVLSPAGITRMEIGGNAKADRKPGEVVYYGGDPYGAVKPQRFDSHGGWIATPSDLLRFLVRVDGRAAKADIITAADHTTMTTALGVNDAAGNDPQYAFGWATGGNTQNHNGTMDGTIAWLLRGPGDLAYAAVTNNADDWFGPDLMTLMNDITAGVSAWPGYDLMGGSAGQPAAYKLAASKVLKSKIVAVEGTKLEAPPATSASKLLRAPGVSVVDTAVEGQAAQAATGTKLLKLRSSGLATAGASAAAKSEQLAALPPTQRYEPPTGPSGLPLLACLTLDGHQCGAAAALAFCQAQGYARASKYDTERKTGKAETLSGEACPTKRCKVFDQVTCAQ